MRGLVSCDGPGDGISVGILARRRPFTDVTNSGNIDCAIAANILTCEVTAGSVTISNTTGSFDVVFSVTPNASGDLNNPAGICRVDPDDVVGECEETNNDCADSVFSSNVVVGGVTVPMSLSSALQPLLLLLALAFTMVAAALMHRRHTA
jgi:hypothetical protein